MAGAGRQTFAGSDLSSQSARGCRASGVVFLVRARTCSGSLSATKLVCDPLEGS